MDISDKNMKKICIVAGEESGEKYGAMLVRALRDRILDAEFSGMGGDEMRSAGVHLINEIGKLTVVGFFEVLSNFGAVYKAFGRLKEHIKRDRPDLLILIDFPDFNIRLAQYAGTQGVKILYFISPQVWAWRKKRVRTIARLVDKMIVIFPFEADFYKRHGIEAHFVGHPLMDMITVRNDKKEMRRKLGVPDGYRFIGLLPGSRNSEVGRILPVLLRAARLLCQTHEKLRFVLPVAQNIERRLVDRLAGQFHDLDLIISHDDYYDIMNALDLAIVASGTATVELALLGKPMVVVYRLNALTYLLAKQLVKIEHVAMVNLIAGKKIVPELIQGDCNAREICSQAGSFLDDDAKMAEAVSELSAIRDKLGEKGMFRKAADIIGAMLV